MAVQLAMIAASVCLLLAGLARSQDAMCCDQARDFPTCREACEQLTSAKSESRLKHLFHMLPVYCLDSLVNFWECINSTLPGVSRRPQGWVGLGCCELAITSDCRLMCRQATSTNDITSLCRRDYEAALYHCVYRNEMGLTCCGQAGRHANCREVCQAVFRTDSAPSSGQLHAVQTYCKGLSPAVLRCVENYTNSYPAHNPRDSLHCCARAGDTACETACKNVLVAKVSEQEMVEGLIKGCGRQPLPQDPLWQCFLANARDFSNGHPIHGTTPMGLDGAKLQCCSRAVSVVCRDLCVALFSTNWKGSQSWVEFERKCEYLPQEGAMTACLSDVREPCHLGCKELKFCTNFNYRPTELFRGCNMQADQGAQSDMNMWTRGVIQMPFLNIPVHDIHHCLPDTWKAIACVLHIKPCHGASPALICRSDCVNILKRCGDTSRFMQGHTAESICDILSPSDNPEECIPLNQYLVSANTGKNTGVFGRGDKSRETAVADWEEIVHPCNPDPCPSGELCEVNRNGCLPGEDCTPFYCLASCKLGEASDFLVPHNGRVRLPEASGDPGCYHLCKCGIGGWLESCVETPCVDVQRACIVGGQRRPHGSHFHIDCNFCTCFAGELICTGRQCLMEHSSYEDRQRFTGLPCNCADHFVPVCAVTGRTYPSACLARCSGLSNTQITYGSCNKHNPCSSQPCPSNQRCVLHQRVCLTSPTRADCPQYKCIPRRTCEKTPPEPVCDTTHNEFPSLCALYAQGRTLAYSGHCQAACAPSLGSICGHDGETYSSMCAAHTHRVTVDYHGQCQAVGLLTVHGGDPECHTVSCFPLPHAGCKPIIPPGACCPICGGMLRLLWSREQMDALSKVAAPEPLTLHDVLEALRRYVSVLQCDAYGYLSIEGDIVVLVLPIDPQPTALQIKACSKEAEKIGALVNSASPVLVSHVPLSALAHAEVLISGGGYSAASPTSPTPALGLYLLTPLILCLLS
uniref:reversion-inducing cysteine-rich protein with Kazal motifs n=1 Tax=Myxine glutinosa TaxID=7769 RepID=UPI00358FF050